MAFDVPTLDTSTRQKLLNQANQFALSPQDIANYMQQYGQQTYGRVAGDISAQFNPAMRMAQARLGASPLLGDSGYANRLNRQLQTSAFGDLSRQYQGGLSDFYQNLINQRNQERSGYLMAGLQGTTKKRKAGDYIAGTVGALGGAALGGWASGGFKTGGGAK